MVMAIIINRIIIVSEIWNDSWVRQRRHLAHIATHGMIEIQVEILVQAYRSRFTKITQRCHCEYMLKRVWIPYFVIPSKAIHNDNRQCQDTKEAKCVNHLQIQSEVSLDSVTKVIEFVPRVIRGHALVKDSLIQLVLVKHLGHGGSFELVSSMLNRIIK